MLYRSAFGHTGIFCEFRWRQFLLFCHYGHYCLSPYSSKLKYVRGVMPMVNGMNFLCDCLQVCIYINYPMCDLEYVMGWFLYIYGAWKQAICKRLTHRRILVMGVWTYVQLVDIWQYLCMQCFSKFFSHYVFHAPYYGVALLCAWPFRCIETVMTTAFAPTTIVRSVRESTVTYANHASLTFERTGLRGHRTSSCCIFVVPGRLCCEPGCTPRIGPSRQCTRLFMGSLIHIVLSFRRLFRGMHPGGGYVGHSHYNGCFLLILRICVRNLKPKHGGKPN